ncbi:MAG: NAAT family transporter [Chromatiaceae bacterium]|nr:NAAT family transporter [Chromatiaceae bacterium]
MVDWMDGLHTLVGLIVIVNPLLAVSAFAALAGGEDPLQRRATAHRAALTVAAVLSASALGGETLLRLFGIGLPAFKVGGGVLILLMAIAMLHARMSGARHTDEEADEAHEKEQVGVVPLGIPLLAGPGAISTVIIYAHAGTGWAGTGLLVLEVWLVAGLVWLALRVGDRVAVVLGTTGMNIATRIMGLLLAAIAVEFITHGLKVLLPGLG